jgi:acyl-CoA synthetase (NDP forming)
VTPGEHLGRTGDPDAPVAGTEVDGLAVLEAQGIPTPRRAFVRSAADVATLDLAAFPGTRVVVKVVSPEILHKSDAGGVAIVDRDRTAIANRIDAMSARFDGCDVRGYLVCAFVPHEDAPGAQLLVGLRRTADFGAVLTLGFGGIHAEALAAHLVHERAVAVMPVDLADDDDRSSWIAAARAAAAVPLALDPQRGRAPRFPTEGLADVLIALARIGRVGDPAIEELEINPLVAGPDGPVALDALIRRGTPRPPTGPAPRPAEAIRRLVTPSSIAILGVSARTANPGRIILRNVLRAGFPFEALRVVKPGVDTIDGVACVPDLAALPGGRTDLLIVAVDAAQVPGVVEEVCGDDRAAGVVVIPGGLGETAGTADRARRIGDALARARASEAGGPVINGGNCLGIRSRKGRYDTLFIPEPKLPAPATRPSPLAVLSQSGAFGITLASRLGAAQPDLLVTFGNQTDLTVGDWMEHVAEDPDYRIVACYVEGFRPGDGARWLAAARRIVAAGRPVILYRAGRTPAGATAAASHTASIAGDWETTRALAAGAGVHVAADLETFHDLVVTFTMLADRPARGPRLGAVSNAGFECVAIADALGSLDLAPFTSGTRARLTGLLAEHGIEGIVDVHDPLDVTPILGDAGFAKAVRIVLEDPDVDVGLIGCVPLTGALDTLPPGPDHDEDLGREGAVAEGILAAVADADKPCVAVVDAGAAYDPLARRLERGGVPTFRNADRALRAIQAFVTAGRGAP